MTNDINILSSGSIAGAVSSILSNPFEVAKTRLQLLDYDVIKGRIGFKKILSDLVIQEGVLGVCKGLKLKMLFRVPGAAITMWGYEYIKDCSRK